MKTIVATVFLPLLSCCAFGQDKAAISSAEAGCGPDNTELSMTIDESRHAGHGLGSTKSQRDSELADELAFLLWQFGAPDFQPQKY